MSQHLRPPAGVIYIALLTLTVCNGLLADLFLFITQRSNWNISPVVPLVLYVAIRLEYMVSARSPRHYRLISIGLFIATLIPSSLAAWLALFCCASYSAIVYWPNNRSPLLLIGLVGSYIWKASAFKLASPTLLELESRALGSLLSLYHPQLMVDHNILYINQQHALALGLGCSALSNLSFLIIGWLAMYFLNCQHAARLSQLTVVTLLMVSLNTLRIAIMSIDKYWYTLAHGGLSSSIYDAMLSLLVCSAIFIKPRHR